MANFDDIKLFGDTSLSDIFKQAHKRTKDTDRQINDLIDTLKPLASSNAGSAVMLMPTVKDLIDVTSTSSNSVDMFDPTEIQQLIDEQRVIQIEGQKLIEQTEVIQHQIENK